MVNDIREGITILVMIFVVNGRVLVWITSNHLNTYLNSNQLTSFIIDFLLVVAKCVGNDFYICYIFPKNYI